MRVTDITDFLGVTDTRSRVPEVPGRPVFDVEKEGEKKVLYAWEAQSRTTKTSDPKFDRTSIVIGVVVALFLIMIGEIWLILVIASMIFLKFMLSAAPSEKVNHEISNHGVSYAGTFYYWSALNHFFFVEQSGIDVLCIDMKEALPGRLYFGIRAGDKEKIKEVVGSYLPFLQEPPRTFLDKAYDMASDRISLDKPSK